jgi:hypothetical protein
VATGAGWLGSASTDILVRDASYVEVARVEGAQAWTATAPYAVTVVPADLLR